MAHFNDSDKPYSTPETAALPFDETDAKLERLEYWLDRRFSVPGIPIRVGLDGIIGLIPGVGDTATALVSGSFIVYGLRIGARKRTIARMTKNVVVDWAVGLIPLFGDIFDFAHKANAKNLRLLREERRHLQSRQKKF